MRKMKHQFLNRFFRYKDAKDGATAIEFALLALPFFALLFAILELAIIFFISSTMTHAVSEAGRKIRTGNFQNCSQDQFKALVCAEMVGLGNCEERLRLDVVTNSNFSSVSLPPPPAPPPTPPPPAPQVAPPIPNGLYGISPRYCQSFILSQIGLTNGIDPPRKHRRYRCPPHASHDSVSERALSCRDSNNLHLEHSG